MLSRQRGCRPNKTRHVVGIGNNRMMGEGGESKIPKFAWTSFMDDHFGHILGSGVTHMIFFF